MTAFNKNNFFQMRNSIAKSSGFMDKSMSTFYSPIDEPYIDEFYYGKIDFQKLIEFLISAKGLPKIFNYKEFISTKTISITELLPIPRIPSGTPLPFKNPSIVIDELTKFPVHNPYIEKNDKSNSLTPEKSTLNMRIGPLSLEDMSWSMTIKAKDRTMIFQYKVPWPETKSNRNAIKDDIFSFTISDKYMAVVLASEYPKTILRTINLLDKSGIEGFKNTIKLVLQKELDQELEGGDLAWLLKRVPYEFFEKVYLSPLRWIAHIIALSDADNYNPFFDESTGIIKLARNVTPNTLYSYFYDNPDQLMSVYDNLDSVFEEKEGEVKNYLAFASLLRAIAEYHNFKILGPSYAKNEQKSSDSKIVFSKKGKKVLQTFYIGSRYKIGSNIFFNNEHEQGKVYLKQQKIVRATESRLEFDDEKMPPRRVEIETEDILDMHEGKYHPLDFVDLVYDDLSSKPIKVPVIYVKALADTSGWHDFDKAVRIGIDILAIILEIAFLTVASPLAVILTGGGVILSLSDISLVLSQDELMKTEEGKKFLEHWNKINLLGGIALVAPFILTGLFRSTAILRSQATMEKTILLLDDSISQIVKRLEIQGFNSGSLRYISTFEDLITLSGGKLNSTHFKELMENGVIFTHAPLKVGKELETGFAVFYKGSILAKGNAKQISKVFKDLKKKHGVKLVQSLDEMEANAIKLLFSAFKGKRINLGLLKKLTEEFKKLGGDMIYDADSWRFIEAQSKSMNTYIEASTFGEELIMLGKDVSTSGVYEELIHARQFRTGRFEELNSKYGNYIGREICEKEAAEELITKQKEYGIPLDEHNHNIERLEIIKSNLTKFGYYD